MAYIIHLCRSVTNVAIHKFKGHESLAKLDIAYIALYLSFLAKPTYDMYELIVFTVFILRVFLAQTFIPDILCLGHYPVHSIA